MGKKYNDEFKYLCKVNVLFTYMEKEIEFAINNKLDLATDFYILYKGVEYLVNIGIDYINDETKIDILLDNKHYYSMEKFKNNATLGEFLIKDIKDTLEIVLIYHDSVYLEENEVIDKQTINYKEFKYEKGFVNTFLYCAIFFMFFAVVSRWMFKGQSGNIIGFIFFDMFAFFWLYVYFYYKRKKIMYCRRTFTVYGIISKKIYSVEDIESVSEQPPKGITVKMKNGEKFKFDTFMTNQRYARRILKQNDIEIEHIPFKNYLEFSKKK